MTVFKIVLFLLSTLLVASCSGGGGDDGDPPLTDTFTVSTSAGAGGSISPASVTVDEGDTTSFTITPDAGFLIDSVTGCNGALSGNSYTTGAISADCTVSASFSATTTTTFTVSASASIGGSISPADAIVNQGDTTSFTITPDAGFLIDSVTGCSGALSGNSYTTGVINADCTVSASFSAITFAVSTSAGAGGSISPASITVNQGDTTSFTITPNTGFFINSVTGCSGALSGNSYTTGVINADCTVSASFNVSGTSSPPVSAATPVLVFEQVKNFRFSWADVADATHYRLLENPDGSSGFTQVGTDISQGVQGTDHIVPLFQRINAQYLLQSCNAAGCTDSVILSVSDTLVGSIGYVKASNTEAEDRFGGALALSGDGNTLAVGADWEDSNVTGINGNQSDNTADNSGAVYVFTRSGSSWSQQAYLKASNTDADDRFGSALALSSDGNTLSVAAIGEDSNAVGIGGNQSDNTASWSGAVYLFTRTGNSWSQQAYLKASNTEASDSFGRAVALSSDGNTLAVGANGENSNAVGIDGDQSDNTASVSGAVYLFTRTGSSWSQQAYLKASNTGADDHFGTAVALSSDGNTLGVGATGERSNAVGIGGNQSDNTASWSGAVYLFIRSDSSWSQQAYVKASNTEAGDFFGTALALSGDGNTLAVGAFFEDNNVVGIGGNQLDNTASASGAVYLFIRSGSSWSQQAYVKASNTDAWDQFGIALALSSDGNTLVVGAHGEESNAVGIGGNQSENMASVSGAVYLFIRSGGSWSQQVYLKASNADAWERFGYALALSSDGDILAVGADWEASNAVGIGGDQFDNTADESGAVYLY